MKISEFDYNLPPSFVANKPLNKRDESKLLVLNRKNNSFEIKKFKDIVNYLEPKDLIVFNDTQVIPARIIGRKPSGGRVEVLLTNKAYAKKWEALVKPGKKAKEGAKIIFGKNFSGVVEKVLEDGKRLINLNYKGGLFKLLNKYGQMPLPPYIKNTPLSEVERRKKYQTVYANKKGAVAAPTAGLHFTKDLIGKIKQKGVNIAYLTLHVNTGTFLPIKEENIKNHKMHPEWYEASQNLINLIKKVKKNGGRVIALGTTSLRVLETIFDKGIGSKYTSLKGWTDIFIYPGYKFKIVDALITNFHLPKSTLLLLVCAFSSKDMIMNAYEKAKEDKFRFYSFGDAMFIL